MGAHLPMTIMPPAAAAAAAAGPAPKAARAAAGGCSAAQAPAATALRLPLPGWGQVPPAAAPPPAGLPLQVRALPGELQLQHALLGWQALEPALLPRLQG